MPIRPENRSRYPKNWQEIRGAILERAEVWVTGSQGFVPRCECQGECGRFSHVGRCPNIDRGFAYDTGSLVVLTVAHLDHTPEHSESSNLRAFCQGCHLHFDREHHARTRAENLRAARSAGGQLELS